MKLKKIRLEDVKAYLKQRKVRREEVIEKRRNSVWGKRLQPVYMWMNRLSIPLHFLLSCVINFVIEAISRHSVVDAWEYMTMSPWAFSFNA